MLKYTKKKPTKPGWYFYRGVPHRDENVGHAHIHEGSWGPVLLAPTDFWKAKEWAGPIEEPRKLTKRK